MSITIETVTAAARELIDERGEGFRYVQGPGLGCFYSPEGFVRGNSDAERAAQFDPRTWTGCLVGEIIRKLDPEMYESIKFSTGDVMDITVDNDDIDLFTRRFLKEAQMTQDEGSTWSAALEDALSLYKDEEGEDEDY